MLLYIKYQVKSFENTRPILYISCSYTVFLDDKTTFFLRCASLVLSAGKSCLSTCISKKKKMKVTGCFHALWNSGGVTQLKPMPVVTLIGGCFIRVHYMIILLIYLDGYFILRISFHSIYESWNCRKLSLL